MRTEQFLFHLIGIKPKSRVTFVHRKGIFLNPRSLATDRSKAMTMTMTILYFW